MKKVILLIITIILWNGVSYGVGNIHLGPLRIYPSAAINETYIDNLFLTTHDKKDELITTFSPGIAFKLPLRRHSLNIEYKADILRFSDYDDLDRVDQSGAGFLEFDFPGGLNIKFGDRYYKTARLPDFLGDWDNPYYINNGGAEISYKFADRYKIKFSY